MAVYLDVSTFNPQTKSLLCTTCPPEIRSLIFQLVLTAFPDPIQPYKFKSYHRRPGYTAPKVTDTRLLLTCKLIYSEARELLWVAGSGNNEEAFWWGSNNRRPPEAAVEVLESMNWFTHTWDSFGQGGTQWGQGFAVEEHDEGDDEADEQQDLGGPDDVGIDISLHHNSDGFGEATSEEAENFITDYIQSHILRSQSPSNSPLQTARHRGFSSHHWSKIQKVDIFPQMYTFQPSGFARFFHSIPTLRPHTVQVTIRYTDWWWWETNKPLELTIAPNLTNPSNYYLPESCNTFILQLESIESNRGQLEEQVRRITDADKQDWKWKRIDDVYLELDEDSFEGGGAVKEWEWMGPTSFGDRDEFGHHPAGDEMRYIVKVLTFKAKPTEVSEEEKLKPFGDVVALREYRRKMGFVLVK